MAANKSDRIWLEGTTIQPHESYTLGCFGIVSRIGHGIGGTFKLVDDRSSLIGIVSFNMLPRPGLINTCAVGSIQPDRWSVSHSGGNYKGGESLGAVDVVVKPA